MPEQSIAKELEARDKARKSFERGGTVKAIVSSAHKLAPLRDWLTLESCPCIPFIERLGAAGLKKAAILHVLFCSKAGERITEPWAYVAWLWPAGRILSIVDIGFSKLSQRKNIEVKREWIATNPLLDQLEKSLVDEQPLPDLPSSLRNAYSLVLEANVESIACLPEDDVSSVPRVESSKNPVAMNPQSSDNATVDLNQKRALINLPEIMKKARKVISQANQPLYLAEWKKLKARMSAPQFTITFAGEFSRGKSTVINKIIDNEFLPVGDLPTTAMVSKISGAKESSATIVSPDGKGTRIIIEDLESFIAEDNGVDPEGTIYIKCDNEWLRKNPVLLVDTPGVGDLIGARAALTTDAIAGSDGAIVVINATIAMSETERAFIEQNVLSKAIPYVGVILTKLDQVNTKDRGNVISHVRKTLASWAPEAKLWISHTKEEIGIESDYPGFGVSKIRDGISRWVNGRDNRTLRASQIRQQLDCLLVNLRETLQDSRDLVMLKIADEAKAVEAEQRIMKRNQLAWREHRLELDSREEALVAEISAELEGLIPEMHQSLSYHLRRTNNPSNWWQDDLPHLLRRELVSQSRMLQSIIGKKIEEDYAWLYRTVRSELKWELPVNRKELRCKIGIDAEQNSRSYEDLADRAFQLKVAGAAATIASYSVLGPLGIAVSLGAGLLTKKVLDEELKQQKIDAQNELKEVIRACIASAEPEINKRIKKIYSGILDQVKHQEQLWVESRTQAINAATSSAGSEDDLKRLNDLLSATEDVITRMCASDSET